MEGPSVCVGGGCVPVCGRRCRCGCVSAWVSCCSECFCRLHVDTCRCIVPHDSTNVSIRHVCMLTHAVASSHMTAENSIGIAQNCIRKTAQSLCVCMWPLVCLCVCVWPLVCLCVCVLPPLNRRHTCDVAFDTKQHLHFYICEWHKTAACAAPRV